MSTLRVCSGSNLYEVVTDLSPTGGNALLLRSSLLCIRCLRIASVSPERSLPEGRGSRGSTPLGAICGVALEETGSLVPGPPWRRPHGPEPEGSFPRFRVEEFAAI